MLKDDREKYEDFFENFGRQLGYGIVSDGRREGKDSGSAAVLLLHAEEAHDAQGVRRAHAGEQKCIYFAARRQRRRRGQAAADRAFADKDYEVLYLTSQTDEFVRRDLMNYDDKPFRSNVDGDLGSRRGRAKGRRARAPRTRMHFVKETLGDKIKVAKVSHRLKTHPVCLTAGEGFTFEMEKYFKNFQMPEPIKAERILELNVDHPAVKAMAAALATDRDKAALYQVPLRSGKPHRGPAARRSQRVHRHGRAADAVSQYWPKGRGEFSAPFFTFSFLPPILAYRRFSA